MTERLNNKYTENHSIFCLVDKWTLSLPIFINIYSVTTIQGGPRAWFHMNEFIPLRSDMKESFRNSSTSHPEGLVGIFHAGKHFVLKILTFLSGSIMGVSSSNDSGALTMLVSLGVTIDAGLHGWIVWTGVSPGRQSPNSSVSTTCFILKFPFISAPGKMVTFLKWTSLESEQNEWQNHLAKVHSTGHASQKCGGIFILLSRCCTPNRDYGIGKLRCWHVLEELNCTVVDQQPIWDDMINSGYLAASIYKPVVNKLWVITTWIVSSMRNHCNYTWTVHTFVWAAKIFWVIIHVFSVLGLSKFKVTNFYFSFSIKYNSYM